MKILTTAHVLRSSSDNFQIKVSSNFEVHKPPAVQPFTKSHLTSAWVLKHRCRSKQIFGSAKDFCSNFSKLARKVFVLLFPKHFLPQRLLRPFVVWPPKKGFHLFSANVGRHFCPDFQGFCQNFSGILPRFSTNQNFWGCAWTPTSYTTFLKYIFTSMRCSLLSNNFSKT